MVESDRPQETSATPPPEIELQNLSVKVPSKTLLSGVNLKFPAGKISLIVGPSGAGKSVFLNLIAGLSRNTISDGVTTEGQLLIDGEDVLKEESTARVGLVFQQYALFDELTVINNVQFGLDHAKEKNSNPDFNRADSFLKALDIPEETPVHRLSGGQKQRLALARTLASNPEIIVYDEPTSGLDPLNAKNVAQMIESSHREHGKTTLIVSHDYESLKSVCDAVFLLDPAQQILRELNPEEFRSLPQQLEELGQLTQKAELTLQKKKLLSFTENVGNFFEGTTRGIESAFKALVALLPLWNNFKWGIHYFKHYLFLLLSPSATVYFLAAGVIAGLVSTHFTFKFLPFKAYTEPLITEELLHGLGFSLYRIVVPVLITILFAARSGAALAADVGSRKYSRQLDALTTLEASPQRYLLTNMIWATLIAIPILVLLAFGSAKLTSLLVFTYNYPQHSPLYWDLHFKRNLVVPDQWWYDQTPWLIAKVLVCGFGTAVIAYFQGIREKLSAISVSRSITLTIIWATLWVLIMHFTFAFIEFEVPEVKKTS